MTQDNITILAQNIIRREGTRIWVNEGNGVIQSYDTRFYKVTEREG